MLHHNNHENVIKNVTLDLYQYDLERVFEHAKAFNTGIGNLTLATSQKQTLQCMAGRTNYPPTILFPLLLLNLGNLWNFNQINS